MIIIGSYMLIWVDKLIMFVIMSHKVTRSQSWKGASGRSFRSSFQEQSWKRYNRHMREEYEDEMERVACGSGRSLSVWDLSASEKISWISTRACIQDICFDDNQILAVGAKPVLSRYDMNGVMLSQIQCVPRSTFSVSLHRSGVMCVAGYGDVVDVISQFGSHLCSFRCHAYR